MLQQYNEINKIKIEFLIYLTLELEMNERLNENCNVKVNDIKDKWIKELMRFWIIFINYFVYWSFRHPMKLSQYIRCLSVTYPAPPPPPQGCVGSGTGRGRVREEAQTIR